VDRGLWIDADVALLQPCIGVARMKRWVRANKLGLNPPIEVLAVLLKEEKKGNSRIERAYVDELMSSKLGDA
jgi:DNA polymerase delta subunit 4